MDSNPPAWTHLLAGALIAMGERAMPLHQNVTPKTQADHDKLVHRVCTVLVHPLWSSWFQVDTPHSRTDLDWAVSTFVREHPTRTAWYRALLKAPTIEIEWRDHQPFIVPHTIARWEILANFFDIDALLTFDLVDKRLADDGMPARLPGLEGWRTLPWVSDHELRRMVGEGVSDLHVHVGGTRIAQALWLDLIGHRKDPRVMRALADAYDQDPFHGLTGGDARQERSRGARLAAEIDNAKQAWRKLVSVSRDAHALTETASRPVTWWTWSHERLNRERWVLIGAWDKILHTARAEDVTAALHTYLGHKHRFFRLLREPVLGGVPGLRHFDDQYFRRAQPVATRAFTGALGSRLRSSPRRDLAPFADACMYLMESSDLRRMELRFAPWGTAADLIRLLGFWHALTTEIRDAFQQRKRTPADIRFALHFVRSSRSNPAGWQRDPNAPRDQPPAGGAAGRRISTETDRIMKELDLSSARLRLSLARPEQRHQRAMRAVARIDVAGQERDTPLSHFVMHMRLLRGDTPMLEVLEGAGAPKDPHPCQRWLRSWLKLRDRRKHIAPIGQPVLGMTAHVGEDYAYDLIDGMAQIGVAVEYLALRAGDSLGHALALVAPLPNRATSPIRMIPRGVRLDSLCWLHDILEHSGEQPHDQLRIRPMIESLGRGIYGDCGVGLTGTHSHARFDDFIWVWKHKMLPRKTDLDRTSEVRRRMVELEYKNDRLIRERERPVPLDAAAPLLNEAIAAAREILLNQIKRRRIVVEMNPASNLRISGASRLHHSPAVLLARLLPEGLLACVNTDNPGVFGSRIENEYALLLQGLDEAGVPQWEARAILDRARATGMDLVYWPGYEGTAAEPNEEGRRRRRGRSSAPA